MTTTHLWQASTSYYAALRSRMYRLDAKDGISCRQQGPKGPPFAEHPDALGHALTRWMPWRWYSLDGTGWCYDSAWDELRRCEDITDPVDWNGVSRTAESAPTYPILALAMFVGVAWVSCCLYFAWSTRAQPRLTHAEGRKEDVQAAGPALHSGLQSGLVWLWRWEQPGSRLGLLACSHGLAFLVALWMPLSLDE
jgi:hypothetical protein